MITPELLQGLFTTALEGGINYWARANHYHWHDQNDNDDLYTFWAEIVVEDSDEIRRVDTNVIELGLRRAIADYQNSLNWSTEPPEMCRHLAEWDYDAGDADMILQLGLFNSVIYG